MPGPRLHGDGGVNVNVPPTCVAVKACLTQEPLVRWMEDSGVLDLADMQGIALHYWNVMDNGRDSMDLLQKLLDRFVFLLPLTVLGAGKRMWSETDKDRQRLELVESAAYANGVQKLCYAVVR